ncbi:hypothetical protein FRC06_007883 [Ceratobasidium sp. 370]|nr:hypothetical protein FRC06_007883 [Ceratobasidium sp. 370]
MSLMLPGSYSQPYTTKSTSRDLEASDPSTPPGPQTTNPSERTSNEDGKNQSEERLDPHTIEDPIGEQKTGRSTNQQAKMSGLEFATEEPRPGYDDYGKELGKDARVWKTYVQEAYRWDSDLVDGWNRFVIESSKSLQPDSTQTSAQTLSVISQTLLAMANNQPGFPLNLTTPETQKFVVSASVLWVNMLWFLSLSLSVAVSLVAMLAKDWAHGYMAELTGQPYQQARKRQRRWDGLKEWKVPEVIMFLPSLLHLALLGLTVYLWNIHLGAAIPVLLITIASAVAYGVSTMLPLLYDHCPYSTPLSKLLVTRIQPGSPPEEYVPQLESDEDLMDDLTSRALAWLIVNYEDTKSADIALQAIAGASAKLPIMPLYNSGANGLLEQRLANCFNTRQTTGKKYVKSKELLEVASLYARALAAPRAFHPEMNQWPHTFWYYSSFDYVSRYLVDDETNLSSLSPNKAAFALACISVSAYTGPNGINPRSYIALTTRLLELHLEDKIALEASALAALLRAATHWPGFELAAGCTTDHIRLMVTLVQFLSTLDSWRSSQMHALVGTALTAFAFANRDYSSWPLPNDSDSRSRSYQAHVIARQYEHSPPSTDTQIESLVTFGLLEFLKHHAERLDENDLSTSINAFNNYRPRPAIIDIFGLPKQAFGFDYQYMIDTLTPVLKSDSQRVYAYSEAIRIACLSAVNFTFVKSCSQGASILILMLENLRSARSGLLKQTCCDLLAGIASVNGEILASGFRRHNPVPLCLEMLECEDERVVPYVMTGLRAIVRITLEGQSLADKATILQPLLSHGPFLDAAQSQGSPYSLTLGTLGRACAEAWLPRLDEMLDRIPLHVSESRIIPWLGISLRFIPQGESHPLHERITHLELRAEQTCGDGRADWS